MKTFLNQQNSLKMSANVKSSKFFTKSIKSNKKFENTGKPSKIFEMSEILKISVFLLFLEALRNFKIPENVSNVFIS